MISAELADLLEKVRVKKEEIKAANEEKRRSTSLIVVASQEVADGGSLPCAKADLGEAIVCLLDRCDIVDKTLASIVDALTKLATKLSDLEKKLERVERVVDRLEEK